MPEFHLSSSLYAHVVKGEAVIRYRIAILIYHTLVLEVLRGRITWQGGGSVGWQAYIQ